ncbi:PREDICTED: probable polygalacturonase At3g15720 [Tarenaya hassleriana]|uniref:probable polygalacturonase At3g15720 n=1 Tax=Tarenaya hassleriana TaxID=28532 RepID=UPI00053C4304|nr:PREDICTED: probable polygalacturonase At3g15720 [Tarenaya hassleriana]
MWERLRYAVLVVTCVAFGFANCQNFNVLSFGAKGDGVTDDSEAFLKAWNAACGGGGNEQTLLIPSDNTFLLQPLVFQGPCRSPYMQVQFSGNIVAPNDKGEWSSCSSNRWIGFSWVSGLTVVGSKTRRIDGRGSSFWNNPNQGNLGGCDWPTSLHFQSCNNLNISGMTSANSPRNHISISGCEQVTISDVNLLAPEDSPNTDGIDISASSYINIVNSYIGTGDDCIAINTGCANINITGVNCGPGHGISVGSLGAKGFKETVENVQVVDCTFNRTTNGARIKTWPGGQGYARNIHFKRITVINARNPIIIDQYYTNDNQSGQASEGNSAVAISHVKFIDFEGTTSDEEAIKFNCSKITRCSDITVEKVQITTADGKLPTATCQNVNGTSLGSVPLVPCLSEL